MIGINYLRCQARELCHTRKHLSRDQLWMTPLTLSSAVTWYLWLVDVIRALHENIPPTLSSHEIRTNMPSSSCDFQRVYRALKEQDCHIDELPALSEAITSDEDAILLLVAILADAITLQLSLGSVVDRARCRSTGTHSTLRNPFLPLSPTSEHERLRRSLSTALDRLQAHLHDTISWATRALFQYCRLYLSFSHLRVYALLHTYLNAHGAGLRARLQDQNADESRKLRDYCAPVAWQVLDAVASRPDRSASSCPPWLPVITFHAAWTVWLSTASQEGDKSRAGSGRVLLAFKIELDSMPWPCCAEMARTLHALMLW